MLSPTFFLEVKQWQLDHIPFEVMWMSREGDIEYVNHALSKRLGFTQQELQGLSIFDVNPRLVRSEWDAHWREVEEEKTVNFKTIHQNKDGFMYDVEVAAQFFSNDRKDLICAIVNEITNSSFYKRVLDTTEALVQVGGWKLNLQDDSIIATEQAMKIFEVQDAQELRPVNVVKYFSNPTRFQELITSAMVRSEPFDEVLGIRDANGVDKWLRCSGLPIEIKGKVKKVMGVYQDITAQQNNILSLGLFKEILNSSEDIIFVWKESGDLMDFSESAIHQLGFSEEELERVRIFDLDDVIDELWWKNHFEDIKQRKNFRMEWKATRKDGSQFPVDISVNHIFYKGQDLNCAILRDISERKQHEQDLRNAFDEIKSLKDQLEIENEYLQEELRINQDDIVCKSESYARVLKLVEQVAPTNTTVLITGESGTGKELLAKALHQNSQRNDHSLVKVNCATLPKDLFESELFGHKKGSFTGAISDKEGKFKVADGGTIFLDEIGEIPVEMQAKLLRVLQEGEFDMIGGRNTIKVDVRVIAATNRNLEEMVKEGTFREDLYYRLNVFPIHNIPLRERMEDIAPLANHFLMKYSTKAGKSFKRVSKKTIDALMKYRFPGNIRELENLIERAVVIESGATLYPGNWMPDFSEEMQHANDDFKSMEAMQRDYILKVLERTNGKVSGPGGAASILVMNDKTLFARMKKLGIEKKTVHVK